MTCQEVDNLIAAYALGALLQQERELLEAHLETCSRHASVIEQYRETVGLLHIGVTDIEPPVSLRGGILSAIQAEQKSIRSDADGFESSQGQRTGARAKLKLRESRGGWQRIGLPRLVAFGTRRPALALLCLLVLGLLVWNLSLQFSDESPNAFARYMGNEDEGIHGQIYFVENVGVITVTGLPGLEAGESYQAWTMKEGQVLSLGALGITESGDGFVLLSDHVTDGEPVFITIESLNGESVLEARSPTGLVVVSTER